MVKRRIIPKLLLKSLQLGNFKKIALVTTVQYSKHINAGDPVSQAKIYEAQSADELIFLNIDYENQDRKLVVEMLKKVSEEIFMPITFGGGVKTVDDFRLLLNSGADKVSINSEAINNPSFITESSKKYGAQCVVVSIDYKNTEEGNRVYINNGTTKTNWEPVEWAIECQKLGAGEILITNINRDGINEGLDTTIINQLSKNINIPIIASGGCGLAKHFIDGFNAGADAVSAGTFFCFKDQSPIQTRSHIANSGIPIRLHK